MRIDSSINGFTWRRSALDNGYYVNQLAENGWKSAGFRPRRGRIYVDPWRRPVRQRRLSDQHPQGRGRRRLRRIADRGALNRARATSRAGHQASAARVPALVGSHPARPGAARRPAPGEGEPVQILAWDPTHDREADLRYLTVAVGRDYHDVAPVSGTYRAPHPGLLSASRRVGVTQVERESPPDLERRSRGQRGPEWSIIHAR